MLILILEKEIGVREEDERDEIDVLQHRDKMTSRNTMDSGKAREMLMYSWNRRIRTRTERAQDRAIKTRHMLPTSLLFLFSFLFFSCSSSLDESPTPPPTQLIYCPSSATLSPPSLLFFPSPSGTSTRLWPICLLKPQQGEVDRTMPHQKVLYCIVLYCTVLFFYVLCCLVLSCPSLSCPVVRYSSSMTHCNI